MVSLKEVKREIARTRERSKIHLTPEEEREFIKKYKSARKMTLQRLMSQTSKKDSKFPQPVRTQPVMEIFTSKDNDYSIAQRIVKLTAKDVKRWGDLIIADVKYDGCYDDTTEVLTRNGWKLFKDVTYDDEIATLEDGEYLCYYKPNAIIVEDFDSEMIHIENSTLDLLVTPNHQLYVDVIDRGGHRKGEYEFVRADEFERGIFKRNAVWLGNDTDYFVLEGVYSKSIPEYRNAVRIPMRLWAEFMGYWLSEGWISVKRANARMGQSYEVGIAQSKSRHYAIMRKCVERLTDILGVKIFDISENIRFSDKRLWLYLRQFGKAGSKFVPKEIKEATPEIIKIFLDAYTLGDGAKRSNYWQIYSTSERMIDDLQELVLKAGYAGRKVVKFEPYIAKESSKLRGRFCNRLFALHIYKNGKKSRLETRIYPERHKNQRLEKVHYTGKVYCVNVPNHVIYVRRNGKAVWCGNCRAMLVVDPKRRDVRILSRRLKPFKKFRKKYKEMILESLSPLVKDQSVFDAELYALSKDGKIIPGHVVSGWVRNPDDERYSNLKPSVQVFDVVMFNKKDLRGLPLKYRKRLLEIALRDSGVLQVADTRRMKNSSRLIDWLFNSKVKKRGFEGLVLKDPEACFSMDTEILTIDGWKFYDELDEDMPVATLSPDGYLEYQKPLRILYYESKPREMFEFDNRSISMRLTMNHRLFVTKTASHDDGIFRFVTVRDMLEGKAWHNPRGGPHKVRFKQTCKWKGEERDVFILPAIKKIKTNSKNKDVYEVPEKKIPMDIWLSFLGIYLSEGCVTWKEGQQYQVSIGCKYDPNSVGRQNPIFRIVDDLTKVIGKTFSKNNGRDFVICDKQLASYLRKFGKAQDKFIPKDIKNLSSRQLKILFDALMLGDGYISKDGRRGYSTISKRLADDIQEVALKISEVGSIYKRFSGYKGKPGKQSGGIGYVITFKKVKRYPNFKPERDNWFVEISEEPVWCVTTNNGVVCVRRNGKIHWSGNSYFYGRPKDNPFRKVKSVDTLDLRLVATEAYPSDKPFRFYKHWRMSPQDSEMIVKADKAIKAAGFDNDFYIGFTKRLLDKWQRGEIKADESAGMVKVDKKFRDIYGMSEVPRKLILGDKGPIVELFVEKMSETLQPSGTKIVRIRDDKEVADTLADMLQLKNLLLGRK